ncbi:ATP-independent periplasmic protein-refolding chaperone Spy [Erwinia amylovora]|uniref:Spheroplast protein Y n=3 Tax=Erwinia amylovora TaxID=552 RepID=A0A831A104_ERWAM|nr:ATP-independent periplasmic protein-refolding chaperone Spy [Erwinia amylovora]CDK15134.1 Spheroplast protein Y precursor [Erwinia amylovora LA635]CDK18502.1 Spheroplast protein Y precursor [Erwinia amylovora LA636]CDK21871.1 Spheroplast protein Y precursor [Erwinia amylovora LA637]ATZ11444.1 ATP-independent periplasmic protein-refolding chaperone [Erwinia amylovora]EKV54338.1 Spheroplast protein Y precursor [Erwinia amylovora ACW56400]
MHKLTAIAVAATLAFGAANLVHAAADNLTPPPAGADNSVMHKPPRHGGPHEMFKDLNLSDAQKLQVRNIMKAARKGMQRPSLQDRRNLHSIIAADSFDRAKAEAQATQMSANGKQRTLLMLETQNKLYNVLTPEQKKQFNQNFEKRLAEKPQHEDRMPPADD